MKRLLTILLLATGTAYGQIDNPPSSVNIVDATAIGRAVLTATNPAAAATAISLGTTNDVSFNRIQVGGASFTTNQFTGGNFAVTSGHALTFASGGDPALTRTNLGLGATNAVTFGNVILDNDGNLAPAQTADSSDSLMTRGLSDARYTTSLFVAQFTDNQLITNGATLLAGPSRINAFSIGYGASVPSGFTEFRVVLSFGWRGDPATNSTNFPVFVRFNNPTEVSSDLREAEHGTVFNRTDLYPTNSTGLAGTLTRVGAFSSNSVYRFISDYEEIPSAWQSNAASNGFYHFMGVAVANNSGTNLNDGGGSGHHHALIGVIEFRK